MILINTREARGVRNYACDSKVRGKRELTPMHNSATFIYFRLAICRSKQITRPASANWRGRVIKTYTGVYKKLSRAVLRTHAHARSPPPSLSFFTLRSARAMQTTRRSTLIKVDNQLMRNKNSARRPFIRS